MSCGGNDTKFTETVNKLRQNFHIGAEHTKTFDYIGISLEQNNNFPLPFTREDTSTV